MQIEQIDRQAMVDYESARPVPLASYFAKNVLAGRFDNDPRVQAFARHRLAALSARPDSDMVERVARAIFVDRTAFDHMTWTDNELSHDCDGELVSTVDGLVNFSAIARAAIATITGGNA